MNVISRFRLQKKQMLINCIRLFIRLPKIIIELKKRTLINCFSINNHQSKTDYKCLMYAFNKMF